MKGGVISTGNVGLSVGCLLSRAGHDTFPEDRRRLRASLDRRRGEGASVLADGRNAS